MAYQNNNQGYIISMVMIFLLIMSLLMMSAMDTAIIETKMSVNMVSQDRLFQLADSALVKISKEFLAGENLPVSDKVATASQLLNPDWWRSHADNITIDNKPIEYTLEFLQQQPCIKIKGVQETGAAFYRITTRALSDNGDTQQLLQDVIALPQIDPQNLCDDFNEVQTIQPGIQSWYQLN